jgi:polyribonucleotide 5'-hydroxyl-kinase
MSQNFRLAAQQELHFELDKGVACFIQVWQGSAEIFGSELKTTYTKNWKEYKVKGTKISIFSREGANIEITNGIKNARMIYNEATIQHLRFVDDVEKMRDNDNPRIMICGAVDTGKSTLSKILINYATRKGHSMLFADIDVGQGEVGIPGTISMCRYDKPSSIETGFEPKDIINYFYGHISPAINAKLYNNCVRQLANCAEELFQKDPSLTKGGIVVNTCGWVEKLGYKLLLFAAKTFKINIIVVMDNTLLSEELTKDLVGNQNLKISVVNLPKSQEITPRSTYQRKIARSIRIGDYFKEFEQVIIDYKDIVIVKFGSVSKNGDALQVNKVSIDNKLKNMVMAIASSVQLDQVVNSDVSCFVYVCGVDLENQKVKLFIPKGQKKSQRKIIDFGIN